MLLFLMLQYTNAFVHKINVNVIDVRPSCTVADCGIDNFLVIKEFWDEFSVTRQRSLC